MKTNVKKKKYTCKTPRDSVSWKLSLRFLWFHENSILKKTYAQATMNLHRISITLST